jgi:hypothetical protein
LAYVHTIDAAARLVTVSGRGESIVAEARASTAAMLADRRITPQFRILIVGDVGAGVPSSEDIAELASLVKQLRGHVSGRIAIVAPTEALVTPAEVVALLGSQPTLWNTEGVRAFSAEGEARAWVLGGSA